MYSDEDDYVRPPDPIRLERLIDHVDSLAFHNSTGSKIEDEDDDHILNMILKQTAEEHDAEIMNQFHDSPEDLLNMILKKTAEEHDEEILDRNTHFAESKKVFLRLSHIDKQNADIYNQVLSFIALYEDGYITRQSVSLEFNMDFFEILGKIRIPKEEVGRWSIFLHVE